MEEKEPAGSVPFNPMQAEDNTQEAPAQEANAEPGTENPKGASGETESSRIEKLEKMLHDSRAMIGRQSTEVGALRQKLEGSLQPAAAPGPSIDEQIDLISERIENGDVSLKDGNRLIAQLSAKMGAETALNSINQRQQKERVLGIQQKFLSDNPDFQELRDNGTLQQYLDADPMADEYVAFKQYKADERVKSLEADYAAKITAAKEEGAKLAQGANATGKVLGKSGSAARAAVSAPKPFKNTQEASAAMLAQLQAMRSKT
jgi:hypothetical protein